MIDLEKLDKEIDDLLNSETSESLTKWLLSNKFCCVSNITEKGTLINMSSFSEPIFSCTQVGNFAPADSLEMGENFNSPKLAA